MVSWTCAILLIASAIWAGTVENSSENLARCLADPTRNDGVRIKVFQEAQILNGDRPGSLVVRERGRGAGVQARLEGADGVSPGTNTVTIVGIFHAPDILRVEELRIHEGRNMKIYFSVPVVFLLGIWLARGFRLTRNGLEAR